MKYLLFILFTIPGLTHAQVSNFDGLKSINGTKLYIKTFGNGEPLLVVHGGPGFNQTYFLPHLESLARHYTVILYDQRACGRSAIPSPDSLGLKFFINDIDAIRRELGYDKINILGHSWGAIPVISYGIDYPDHVNTMILCNPVPLNHEFDAEMAAAQKKWMTKQDSLDRVLLLKSSEFKSGNAAAYQKLMLISFRHAFYAPENFSKLNLELPGNYSVASKALYTGLGKDLGQYDFYPAIAKFKFPVLVLHGRADGIPLKASQKIQENLPSSRLVIFEKSGHFIFIEEKKKFEEEIGYLIPGPSPKRRREE